MLSLELGIVTVLIVINGLLSMSELAIVSSRPARLAALVEKGIRGSRRALALASDPGKFLSTVQIGITLIGVLSGAISGATLGQRLSDMADRRSDYRQAWPTRSASALVVTVIHLRLADYRRTGAEADRAARSGGGRGARRAGDGDGSRAISLPLVWLLDRSGKGLLWLLGQRGDSRGQGQRGRDPLRWSSEAESAGVLEPGEKEMIAGVMRLGDLPVGAVMTPRHEVSMIDLADPRCEVIRGRAAADSNALSLSVVFDGDRDSAAFGIIQAKDCSTPISAAARPTFARWCARRR